MDDKDKLIELKQKADKKKLRRVIPEFGPRSEETKAAMRKATIHEDEVHKRSQAASTAYLKQCADENRKIPAYGYILLGVAFGFILAISIENVILNTPIVDWIAKMWF